LTQHQSDEEHHPIINKMSKKSFVNFWTGMFFLISSLSVIIVLLMFVFVWQPIWTEGFEDFHTISNAIDKLNKTAQPASEVVPLMLVEMGNMNKNMYEMNKHMQEMYTMNKNMLEMQNTMRDMSASMGNIEEMTPNIKRMTLSIEQMTMVLSTELPRMNYSIGRLDNKMPNMDFMPFN
jgi:hypothetical protein